MLFKRYIFGGILVFFEISSKKLSETRHGNPYLQQKGAIPKNRQTPWKKGGAASFRGSLFQRHPGTCPGNAKQRRKKGSRKGEKRIDENMAMKQRATGRRRRRGFQEITTTDKRTMIPFPLPCIRPLCFFLLSPFPPPPPAL